MSSQDWIADVVNSHVAPKDIYFTELSDSETDTDSDIEPDTDAKAYQKLPSVSNQSSPAPSSSSASSIMVLNHLPKNDPLSLFHLALGLWVEKSNQLTRFGKIIRSSVLSREDVVALGKDQEKSDKYPGEDFGLGGEAYRGGAVNLKRDDN